MSPTLLLLIIKYACIDLLPLTSAICYVTALQLLIYTTNYSFQMRQIRTALAIASVLNRTLVRLCIDVSLFPL